MDGLILYGLLWYSVGCFSRVYLALSHGAIDHILASDVLGWIKPAQQLRFMGQYIAVMCLYGLLWSLLLVVGFWMFLLYSAWHFGQSDALSIWNVLPKGLGHIHCYVMGSCRDQFHSIVS